MVKEDIKTLNQLVDKLCTNYIHRQCIFGGGKCKVKNKKPCSYFEKFVLPPIDYKFSLRIRSLPEIHHQYALIAPDFQNETTKLRYCKCGSPLEKGKRLCKKCREKNRRKTMRKQKRRQRKERG